MKSIAAIIPTRNEEVHIGRCIDSIIFTEHIFILDSQSDDNTIGIAVQRGCSLFSYPQDIIFSEKLNDALCKLLYFDLVIRVDADEIVSHNLSNLIIDLLASTEQLLPAYTVSRKLCFASKTMRWGGTQSYPLRIVNPKYVSYQTTLIDEHIDLFGFRSGMLAGDIYDYPLHGYSHWLCKHVSYSQKESKSFYSPKLFRQKPILSRLYYRLPIFIRPILLFIFRYVFLLGFLDGKSGLYYHISQSFLYRFIVDIRIASDL